MFQYVWVTQMVCWVSSRAINGRKAAQVEVETQEFSIIDQFMFLIERKVDFWHFGMAADLFLELKLRLQKCIFSSK